MGTGTPPQALTEQPSHPVAPVPSHSSCEFRISRDCLFWMHCYCQCCLAYSGVELRTWRFVALVRQGSLESPMLDPSGSMRSCAIFYQGSVHRKTGAPRHRFWSQCPVDPGSSYCGPTWRDREGGAPSAVASCRLQSDLLRLQEMAGLCSQGIGRTKHTTPSLPKVIFDPISCPARKDLRCNTEYTACAWHHGLAKLKTKHTGQVLGL